MIFEILLAVGGLGGTAAAQPVSLFVPRAPAADARLALTAPVSAKDAVVARSTVDVRLDVLFDGAGAASAVALNTETGTWIARLERVDYDRAGFRSWVGAIDGIAHSHVVFTERDGVISGLINAVGVLYQLRTVVSGTYVLERLDGERLGDERDPVAASSVEAAADPRMLGTAGDDGQTIDVLLLYTPAARNRVGGTSQIQALASQIISDTNTSFSRSGVLTRVRLAGVTELTFTEQSDMNADLAAFQASAMARALRDQARADVAQLLVSAPTSPSCGVGYLLPSLGSSGLDAFAFSLADVDCAAQYTPSHEIGHNLGSHHAPEDGASGALFAYSYGWKDSARGFRTVMAYGCSTGSCPRVLQWSNPTVTFNGGATGSASQDNARSINQAAFTVANFRQATPTTVTPPSAPTGLNSQVAGNFVTVSWNAVGSDAVADAASSYVLQVGSAPGAANLFSASVGAATSAAGTVANGTYFWRVVAVNAAGASPPSAEAQFTAGTVCVAPSAPQQFAFSVSNRNVTLQWAPPATGSAPLAYILEAGSAPTLANLLVAPIGATTTFATPAPPGTYFVRIRAQNACGASAASNELIILVP